MSEQADRGGVITVCGMSAMLQEIFRIAHCETLFEIHADSATAYRALSTKAKLD